MKLTPLHGRQAEKLAKKTSDYFYPISANRKEDILTKCRDIGINAIVSSGSDIAAQKCAYVAQVLKLPGNSFENVRRASNEINLRDTLAQHGISQPKYTVTGDTIPFYELNSPQYPLVVKPIDRSGGRGLTYVNNASELFSAINTAREASFERKDIVEEYTNGQLYSL